MKNELLHGLLASEDNQSAENLVKVQNFSSLSRLVGCVEVMLNFTKEI